MDRVIEFSTNHPLLVAALAAVLVAIIANEVLSYRRRRDALTPGDATRLYNQDKAVFIDVRNENAFQASHLPGAVNIPMEHLDKRGDRLARFKDKTLIVYCDNGQRTLRAVQTLKSQGWPDVFQLRGGLTAWREESFPTEGKR
ncbi:rhodanese-like domain-containing protein [Spiribacter pallidus]|jgi:rhodanese-related sulfurtransferase|uniref:Rhodanese-like domain-containing protein n=1 Tax=Spiribacter pallidus TaxID=1987936 RepID=A0ABV3TE77_9GAMM